MMKRLKIPFGLSERDYDREIHRDVGVAGGIRTRDLLIRSQTLYPAELRAHDLSTVKL